VRDGEGRAAGEGGDGGSGDDGSEAGGGVDGGSGDGTGRRLRAGPRSRRVCVGGTIRRGGFAATDGAATERPGMLMP
jgi:hypothetical protein